MGPKSFWNLRIGDLNINLFLHVRPKAKLWMFDSAYMTGDQMKLFQQNIAYFIAAYVKNNNLQC